MKDTVRLNFEFPREHYPYLKMLCAQKGLSLKDFASALLIRKIEEYEEGLLVKEAEGRLDEMETSENIDFDEAARLAGWSDVESE
ncbi:hypothetical protein JYU14_00865 [Simkania negevensis]|uniref:CopG family transcriptional regulator n=1 Tax=Simkania negevensis TaxID=83561 RepID=A0ABS3AQ68_9BACT|nr:hypothetical protein [Simkania negevensis]